MSIRKRDVHFSDWTKVRHALVCNNVQGITETSSFDEVRAFLINSESGSNPFYYYVCYIKETNEIYTHGTFYNCTGYNDSDIRDLIQNVEDSFVEQITALQNEVEENEKVTTMALYDLNDRKANKDDLQNINLDKYVDWDSLYNETNSLYSSLQSSINSNYTTLNNNKADKTDLEALSAEVEENEEVTAAALTELHENKADKSEIPDFSTLATKADLAPLEACCDTKLSCEDLGTINGKSICGNDVTITEPDHDASGTATVDGFGFVTSVTTNEAGHVTKVSARAITDNDITSISASKITGTINIDNLPTGALERMFVVEDETAAMSATVEEGDVVQVTGNDNKMYFCVRSGATTFSEKFMEFTAGTATSVAWSGITGKPEGIDGWGDRISAVEADYFSRTGGTITGDVANPLTINRTTMDSVGLLLRANNIIKGEFGWASASGTYIYNAPSGGLLGIKDDGTPHFQGNTLLHSGNYSEYALPITGGVANGSIFIGGYDNTSNYYLATTRYGHFARINNLNDGCYISFGERSGQGTFATEKTLKIGDKGIQYSDDGGSSYKEVLHSGNYSEYAVKKNMGINIAIADNEYGYGYVNGGWPEAGSAMVFGAGNYKAGVQVGALGSAIRYGYTAGTTSFTWRTILDENNYSNYALPITGGAVSGNVAIGGTTASEKLEVHGNVKATNFIGNLTGEALTSTLSYSLGGGHSLTTDRNRLTFLSGQFDNNTTPTAGQAYIGSSENWDVISVPVLDGTTLRANAMVMRMGFNTKFWHELATRPNGRELYHRSVQNGVSNEWGKLLDSSNYSDYALPITGGTISGAVSIEGIYYSTGTVKVGSKVGLSLGDKWFGTSIWSEGSGLGYIQQQRFDGTATTYDLCLQPFGGNVAIGGTTADSKLHVNGNIRIDGASNPLLSLKRGSDAARYVQAVSTGLRIGVGGTTNLLIQDDGKCKAVDFITTSDNRLKDFVSDIDLDFEALKLIPKKYYYWKDKSMGEDLQIGTSAQELAKIYPTCVSYDEVSDRYSVNYQKLSIVALAAIDKLHERVSELESKLND